jgi:predicted NUDIX family NTP pyrophosphohydrolase
MAAAKVSAGLLVYRRPSPASVEVFIVHPGGPFFAKKDAGAWSIPKGLLDEDEDPVACARREFEEEVGQPAPAGPLLDLGEIRLKSGKRVHGFAGEGEVDPAALKSNTFTMQWPPRSGREVSFPEVDRGEWFSPDAARVKLNPAQGPLIDRLLDELGLGRSADDASAARGAGEADDR